MALSPRRRMLAGFVLANAAIAAVATFALLKAPDTPPQIQGVLMSEARPLPDFELIDQQGESFDNSDLMGNWHLVSYGFTTCPDICPTTLTHLGELIRALEQQREPAPEVLFYSVDHRRDTPAQLASYLPFFNPDFIGLTHIDDPENPHLPFERGLGIVAKLEAADLQGADSQGADSPADSVDPNAYRVSHGVTLLLLNPAGELRAVFKPQTTASGIPAFSTKTLLQDYLAVRHYLEG